MTLRDFSVFSNVKKYFAGKSNRIKTTTTALPDEIDQLVRLGDASLENKNYELALSCFEKAASQLPSNLEYQLKIVRTEILLDNLEAAEEHLRDHLNRATDSVEGNALLAEIYLTREQYVDAVQCLKSALAINPRADGIRLQLVDALQRSDRPIDALNELATRLETASNWELGLWRTAELQQLIGQHDSATETLKKLLEINPINGNYWNALGCANRENNLPNVALESFNKAVQYDPENAKYLLNAANTALSLNQIDIARNYLELGIAAHRLDYDLLLSRAQIHIAENRHALARTDLESCLEINPENADAYRLLCHLSLSDGDQEDGLYYGTLATRYGPDDSQAWRSLAQAELESRQYTDASESLKKALKLGANDAQLYFDLGTAYFWSTQYTDAVTALRNAVSIQPDSLKIKNALTLALREIGAYDEAIDILKSILQTQPDYVNALVNTGLLYSDLGNSDQAEQYFSRALSKSPDDETRINRALNFLSSGKFEQGWPLYEARWNTEKCRQRPFHFPRWNGEPIDGKNILVYGEQGLGDELMFASCIPDLARIAGEITIECDPKLTRLFLRSFNGAIVHTRTKSEKIDWIDKAKPFDYQIPMGSLPLHFRKNAADFPRHNGYLIADPKRIQYWRNRLQSMGESPKIGISWRGGAPQTRQNLRSISLDQFVEAIGPGRATFINLQYGDSERDRSELLENKNILVHHFPDALEDYDETAALVCAIDLVISVQTAIVHLAGSLGRPVWGLIPFSPEWRYGRNNSSIVWYPSATLFRQSKSRSWAEPLKEVGAAYTNLCKYTNT